MLIFLLHYLTRYSQVGITPTMVSPYSLGTAAQMSGYPMHATSPGSWVPHTPYVMQQQMTPVSVSILYKYARMEIPT